MVRDDFAPCARLFPPRAKIGEKMQDWQTVLNAYVMPGSALRPRVLYMVNGASAIAFYRAWLPAREMAAAGQARCAVTWDQDRDGLDALLENSDCVICSVPSDKNTLARIQAHRDKFLFVVDLDDNLADLPTTNAAWPYWKAQGHDAVLQSYLDEADMITVPTMGLRSLVGRDQTLDRIAVIPNCIDFRNPVWTEPAVNVRDERWIGFAGSYSHLPDLPVIEAPLQTVLRENPDYRYITYSQIEMHYALDLPPAQKYWMRQRPLETYPSGLRALEVGLAPLADSLFSRGKSPLKVLEYVAANVLPVASRVGPYQEIGGLIRRWAEAQGWRGQDVLPLADSPDEWEHHIEGSLRGVPVYGQRMEVLSAYVKQACTSAGLAGLSTVYGEASKKLRGKPLCSEN